MNLDRAADTRAGDLMTRDVVRVAPGTLLRDALERMVDANVGSVVVSNAPEGAPLRRADVIGMVPVFFALRESLRRGEARPVEAAMFTECIDAQIGERIADVLRRINDNRTWRLLVNDGEHVVGILSATDIVRCFGDAVRRETNMNIGIDTAFHNIDITWSGRTAHFRRDGEFVTDVEDVQSIDVERRELPESEQTVMLLRLRSGDGSVRTLFLDADPVQSNVREVAPELERLDDVFDWLLEPGYVHRQGDVGIYPASDIPPAARCLAPAEYADAFEPILSKRHQPSPAERCEFFVAQNAWFVRAGEGVRLVHPEHHAIALQPGLYEFRGARGTPLPSFSGLRAHERSALGE
jgi:CBS domain-containing protein